MSGPANWSPSRIGVEVGKVGGIRRCYVNIHFNQCVGSD